MFLFLTNIVKRSNLKYMKKSKFTGADTKTLVEEASRFGSRTEFFKKSRAAYEECLRLDIMDLACSHMIKHNALTGTHGNCTISNEQLFLLAKPFKHRGRFKEAHPSAYEAARKRGLLDKICVHMVPSSNLLKRKIYAFEHSDNTVYVGLSYDPNRRKVAHLNENKTLILKSKTTVQTFRILTDYLSPEEASKKERYFIDHYLNSGWVILNKAKGGSLGGSRIKWTKIKSTEIANTCTTRVEFFNKNPGAYRAAIKYGWLEELCSHITPNRTEPWKDEELEQIAATCKTKYELKKKNPGAYKTASKRGILNKICAHMPQDCRILPYKDRPKH
jgi:predicted GIY-YIG superfamily endonuclease